MPNRIIKDSINESAGINSASPFAQDLYKRLITYADDYGRFNADSELMRARLYPREVESVTTGDIDDALIELAGADKIGFYVSRMRGVADPFGYFPNWSEHQRIRMSKKRCPDPDEEINDWALRRFIPIDMKVIIFERDKFTCRECGRCLALPCMSTRRAIRLIGGAFHIDHVVPVGMGGRATLENLRLLCACCNQSRPKLPLVDELRQLAANCGEPPHDAARARVESESESESESNTCPNGHSPIPEESDHKQAIFDHWNAQNIVRHRKLDDKIRRSIGGALAVYSETEVVQAIDNYAQVLASPEHFFKYKWTLRDFLVRGLDKFMLKDVCWENYRKDHGGVNGTNQQGARALPTKYSPTPDYGPDPFGTGHEEVQTG